MTTPQPGPEFRLDAAAVEAGVRRLEPVLVEIAAVSREVDELSAQVAQVCGAHTSGLVLVRAHTQLTAAATAALDQARMAVSDYVDALTRAAGVLVDNDSEAVDAFRTTQDR